MAGDHFPAADRPDESASIIFAEHAWLQGAFLAAVAYGIEFVLYAMASYLLWIHRRAQSQINERNIFLIFYISIIFILSTLYMAGLLQFTQESFIDGRNIQGGPDTFENIMFSLPVDMLANVIMVLNTWLCDIVNVWRCVVIYKGSRVFPAWGVSTIPVLLYFGSVAFGILFLKQVGTVNQSPWDSSGINFTIPYYSMSLALNILVTILIVLRLLWYRHQITKAMGSSHGSQYTSLVAMVVESAAIYSGYALAFLVPFAVNSSLSPLFLQGLSMVQGASTFLIIFRIAQGKGWSHEMYTKAITTTQTPGVNVGATHTFGGTPKANMPQSTFASSESNLKSDVTPAEAPIMLRSFQPSASDAEGIEISKAVYVERDDHI